MSDLFNDDAGMANIVRQPGQAACGRSPTTTREEIEYDVLRGALRFTRELKQGPRAPRSNDGRRRS